MNSTPGPWKYRHEADNGLYEIHDTHFARICEANEEQDAHLIAAAPDLLEACKLIFGHIENGTLVRDISKDENADWGLKMMCFIRDLNKIQAAILKAEGGKV